MATQDRQPRPVWAGAACERSRWDGSVPARSDSGCWRQRQRLCRGCGFASAKITHRAGAAVFDAAQRCRMLCRHPSTEKGRCFEGVCSSVRLGGGSLVGPSQSGHPEWFSRAGQLSMRRAAQPTIRGSFGSCWRVECNARSLGCQILAASDFGRAPDARETNG